MVLDSVQSTEYGMLADVADLESPTALPRLEPEQGPPTAHGSRFLDPSIPGTPPKAPDT